MLRILYFLCVFILSLGQFSSIYKQGELNIYLFDIVVGAFFVLGFLYFFLKKSLFLPKAFIPLGLISLIMMLSLFFVSYKYSLLELAAAFSYTLRWIAYFGAAIVIFNLRKKDMISKNDIYYSIVLSGVFLSVAGFVQLLVLPDFTVLDEALGWDPHKNRLASTFFDPNFLGAYFSICLGFILNKFFNNKLQKIDTASFVIIFIALLLTFSRSAWLMFSIVILVFGMFRSKVLLFSALIGMFLAYYAVPRVQTRISGVTDPADSAHYRLLSWSNAASIAKGHAFLGVGFNAYRYAQKDYGYLDADDFYIHSGAGADSSILFVLATTGILGLTLFLLGFLSPLIKKFGDPQEKTFIVSIILGLLIESLFINSLFYPQLLFLWLTLYASHFVFRI